MALPGQFSVELLGGLTTWWCSSCCCPSAVGLGQYGVVPNYFEQNQAEALDLNLTVLDTLIK
jgi:hypothetical protein